MQLASYHFYDVRTTKVGEQNGGSYTVGNKTVKIATCITEGIESKKGKTLRLLQNKFTYEIASFKISNLMYEFESWKFKYRNKTGGLQMESFRELMALTCKKDGKEDQT